MPTPEEIKATQAENRKQFGIAEPLRPNATVAEKNNNPGNLRSWGGYKTENGFAKFPDLETGWTKLKTQVKIDAKPERKHTVETFVNKFAPKSENNTDKYIEYFIDSLKDKMPELKKDTPFNVVVNKLGESTVAKVIAKKENKYTYEQLLKSNFFETSSSSTSAEKPIVKPITNAKPSVETKPKVTTTVVTTTKQPNKPNTASTTTKTVEVKKDPSRVDEFMGVVKREGIGSALVQAWNYVTSSPEEGNVVKPKEIVLVDKKQPVSKTKQVVQEPKTPSIKLLNDTIKDNANNDRVYVGFSINANDNTFGFRNRKEETDIKTKAAVAHTYNQFRRANSYVGKVEPGFGEKNGKNSVNDHVIALNTKTGKIATGIAKDFNNDYVLSRALPPKEITDIEVNTNAPKNKNLGNKKTITLVYNTGKKEQGQIAFGSTGYEMGQAGYDGGKILVTTPDGKHTQLIYGSAQNLKSELNNFKNTYNVDYVKFYDLDQKAFSQAVQTKSGILKKDLLIGLDNTNSSGGNFLYLK